MRQVRNHRDEPVRGVHIQLERVAFALTLILSFILTQPLESYDERWHPLEPWLRLDLERRGAQRALPTTHTCLEARGMSEHDDRTESPSRSTRQAYVAHRADMESRAWTYDMTERRAQEPVRALNHVHGSMTRQSGVIGRYRERVIK